MKAVILAAGLGSRLKKLTKDTPKALVKVNGTTMLESLILRLKKQGFDEFLINIHHHGLKIIDYLTINNNFGVNITISDERNKLLDTGGAILKAKDFIIGNDPVLIHNVDIISDLQFDLLREYHNSKNSIATLCVRERETNRGLLFNNNMLLTGWVNKSKNQFKWVKSEQSSFHNYAYSGIYMINPDFISEITFRGQFSIIDAWLDIAGRKDISGYVDDSLVWHDLGTIDKINTVEQNQKLL